jgi:adenylate cyclase
MSPRLEIKTPPLAPNCLVCGLPLVGLTAVFLRWRGIRRSPRNLNICTQCGTHLEEGRLVEMTVVFADLSGFTEITGRLGATTTYSVVDEFLRLASTTLMSHGAFIDKYIGDAVMALFNVPIKRADHAAAAVAASAKLQELLPELSERLGVPLRASIGIASGFARVGRLGSDDIKDYTAIGDAVNQAARLQAQAGPSEQSSNNSAPTVARTGISRGWNSENQNSAVIRWYAHAVSHNRVGPQTGRASGSVILKPWTRRGTDSFLGQ